MLASAGTRAAEELRAGDWVQDWDGKWQEVFEVIPLGGLFHAWLRGVPSPRGLRTFRRGDKVQVSRQQ